MHLDPLRGAAPLLATLASAGLLAAQPARAEFEDRALAAFVRPVAPTPALAATARGAPVDRLEWERRLRPADRFGPAVLRAADAALLAAARAGRWREVSELLASGRANPNARDELGGHALVLAARAGEEAILREFIKRGADLDRTGDDGFTALGAAAFEGHRGTVRLLVRAGAALEQWGAGGQTALHLASLAGRLDAVEELLRLGADIELLNRQRETALDVAAAAGQQEVMDRLIGGGADLTLAGRR